MIVKKAGCILLDFNNKKVGIIYRKKHNDYSFPKGHLEVGETLEECAIRETEEETGRICRIINFKDLPVLSYIDSKGHSVEAHYYLSYDEGSSLEVFNESLVHDILWLSLNDVEYKLSNSNLISFWSKIKPIVSDVLNDLK
ncbi:MAG: NUDIX domain-containing protein [Clostridia bacterium]|nr:NUDIX domain-containing protein [Clostridia bacterium]MDD4387009.1 NUDIX domain-containing protein [Clostridia bacterium]